MKRITRRDFCEGSIASSVTAGLGLYSYGKEEVNEKKKFGQYFTPEDMATFMVGLSAVKPSDKILEPSAGEGVFIKILQGRGCENIDGYEIDPALADKFNCVRCESFVSANIKGGYKLVIGNPPYIRWKNLDEELKEELEHNELWNKYFNALCDYSYIFMLKGVELLDDGGELIFICPEYWMNTTNSCSLRDYFVTHGYFSDIFIFNEAPIFKGATVSTVVFRFVKAHTETKPKIRIARFTQKTNIGKSELLKLRRREQMPFVEYFEIEQFHEGSRWVFAVDEDRRRLDRLMESCREDVKGDSLFSESRMITVGDVCDIGNGMVSGLDKAFQIPDGIQLTKRETECSIQVYKAKDLRQFYAEKATRYVNIPDTVTSESEFKGEFPNFHRILLPFIGDLKDRYQYNREIPYWQWCFKRNEKMFSKNVPRIFVPCKERISAKDYVRFSYASSGYYPTQDVTALFRKDTAKESLEYILAYLNHPAVFLWIKNYGIIKGNIVEFSERPLASIPFRKINWNDAKEVSIHNFITDSVKRYLENKEPNIINEINNTMEHLWQ